MNTKVLTSVSFAGLLALCGSPFIGAARAENAANPAQPDRAQLIQKLADAKHTAEYKEKFWSQEPLTQADYDMQEAALQRLIDRLNAGGSVSPDEVNQALQSPSTPY